MNSRIVLACLLLGWSVSLLACSSDEPSNDPHAGGGGNGGGGASGGKGGAPSAGSPATAGSGGRAEAGSGGSASGGKGTAGSEEPGGEGGAESGGSGPGPGPDEYGFSYRLPGDDNLDWLCTFNDGDESGHVYVQLTQTGTAQIGLGEVPVYSADLSQISIEGTVSALSEVEYDYGGGHHNDSLTLDYAGKSHRYYHSSFGFGFRSCQNMDCRNVHALGTTTIETEGCATDRRLPEVCVTIRADGTHDALTDEFMKCPGDM